MPKKNKQINNLEKLAKRTNQKQMKKFENGIKIICKFLLN